MRWIVLLLIAFVAYKLISGFGGGGSGVGGALPPITAKYLSGSKPYLKGKPAVIDASGSLAKHFGVRGIPYAVLVDALGTVKWAGHPMELTTAKIQALLL